MAKVRQCLNKPDKQSTSAALKQATVYYISLPSSALSQALSSAASSDLLASLLQEVPQRMTYQLLQQHDMVLPSSLM